MWLSNIIDRIRGINAAKFNRACAVIGLLAILLLVGVRVVRDEVRQTNNVQDFPQYYMAGLIARAGAWDSLYPIPHAGIAINPGLGHNSDLRPAALALASEHDISPLATRYIQLPALAIAFIPLTFFSMNVAWIFWLALSVFAVWGIAIQAGRICEICLHRRSHLAGGIILLICFSPSAIRWVRVGNMSVFIGWLISFAVSELIDHDRFRGALALTIGTLAKYILIVFAPMYLVMHRWRSIAWSVALAIVLVGGSLLVTGFEPYRIFARDIAPTLGRSTTISENQSLYPVLLRMIHKEYPPLPRAMEIPFRIFMWLALLAVLTIIATRARNFWQEPSHVFAGALALLTWLLIFSPICWEHYHAYLAPFWGWLVYQATRSRVNLLLAACAIALSSAPLTLMFHVRAPEPAFSHLFCALAIIFGMSIAALVERNRASVDDA